MSIGLVNVPFFNMISFSHKCGCVFRLIPDTDSGSSRTLENQNFGADSGAGQPSTRRYGPALVKVDSLTRGGAHADGETDHAQNPGSAAAQI
jgi:hypothetical protein